jgi:uncharacterized protein
VIHMRCLALVMLLLASALPVQARVPTSCGAQDMLAKLRIEAPEAYQRVMVAARDVPNGDGMLWRVEKPGLPASYLFGTMHSTDPRADRQVARVRPLVRSSRAVAVEISELVTPGLKEKASVEIARAGLARSGNALEGLWPPANRTLVETVLVTRGLTPERAQRLETWFLIVALSSPLCERQRRELGLISVDEKIGLAAQKSGKTTVGLEKLEDQIAVLRRIGGLNPSMALIQVARGQTEVADMRETMTQAYIGDRLGELAALARLSEVLAGQPATIGHDAFSRALLDDRNIVMRDRALPLFEKGGGFVAVGALHLPGERGLVAMLKASGYTVSVVKSR